MRRRLVLLLILSSLGGNAWAATLFVDPWGTGDYPTIQDAGLAAHPGDTLLLADGVFAGPGNHDILISWGPLTVRSQSGAPPACVIDCQVVRSYSMELVSEAAPFTATSARRSPWSTAPCARTWLRLDARWVCATMLRCHWNTASWLPARWDVPSMPC